MEKVTLKALKDQRYSTRQLKAGDIFEATRRDAKLLQAIKRAEAYTAPAPVEPPQKPVIVESEVEWPYTGQEPVAKKSKKKSSKDE